MIPNFKKPSPNKLPDTRIPAQVTTWHYDRETRKLTVEFHGGRKYEYDNVSARKAREFDSAKSQGSFVFEHLTPHHTFKRL